MTPSRIRASCLWTLSALAGCNDPSATAVLSSIEIVSGDGQSRAAGEVVRIAPVVALRDSQGRPLAGVAVTFAALEAGASASPSVVFTDDSGRAALTSWRLTPAGGVNRLRAGRTESTRWS